MPRPIPDIPIELLNGGLDSAILVGVSASYPYNTDGKRVSDTPDKHRYDVVLPGNCFAPLSVKIPGSVDALASVTDEMIAEACATLRPILVRFTDGIVKIYTIRGEQKMSATATSVELVKTSSK